MSKRVLITGSRHWTDKNTIEYALQSVCKHFGDETVLVHGNCPTGADNIASTLWQSWGLQHEPHDADWNTHGKKAGPIRNVEMVNSSIDLCLAFPLGNSRGTQHCMREAAKADILTFTFDS